MKNNIILIGFMGCGKSTIGIRLSEDYGIEFLDTDAWIEEKEQITISEIFASKGEPYFRQLETNCLEVLLEESAIDGSKSTVRKVVSVGGGLPMKEENRQILKKLGTVIYLKATGETIYNRLKTDTTRPLLQGDNPKQKIKNLMEQREEIYCQAADHIVVVDDKKVVDIIEEIKKLL